MNQDRMTQLMNRAARIAWRGHGADSATRRTELDAFLAHPRQVRKLKMIKYRPLTKIRGMTLEKIGAKIRFLARVRFQKIPANHLLSFFDSSFRFFVVQTRQIRHSWGGGAQDLWISENALLKNAPYFKKPLTLKNPLFS